MHHGVWQYHSCDVDHDIVHAFKSLHEGVDGFIVASAGVTVGCMAYLCLKNTVSERQVLQ